MKHTKFKRTLLTVCAVILLAALTVVAVYYVQKAGMRASTELSVEEAQKITDEALSALPGSVATGAKLIADRSHVTVTGVSYGNEKDVLLDCTYRTVAAGKIVTENLDRYLADAYRFYRDNEEKGVKTNATKVKLLVTENMEKDLSTAEETEGTIRLTLYEMSEGNYSLYLSDDVVNTVFGGILDAKEAINSADTVEYEGQNVSITNKNSLRSGIRDCVGLSNYNSRKPDTSVPIERVWNDFKHEFHRNFIEDRHWTYITNGLKTTLEITLLAVLLGILIGFLVAVIRCVNQKTGRLGIGAAICKLYLSVMRGTPVMVQLLIIYFVILLPIGVEKFPAAVLCFGLNSGAYVSEIVRGGIMSIDDGQTEAGRSLGFTYMQTMIYIIIPQAFKAVLPSLANEFIALLKESSVAFYIGVADLTQGGIKIRSITYSNFMPLIAVAVVYLIVVLGLSRCVALLERRLNKGENSQ